MATPKKGYWYAGERLPGTTTVCGRFKDSSALMIWAFKQGQSGAASLYENSGKAADIGTCAHAMIESHINGADPLTALAGLADDPAMKDKAAQSFDNYLQWEHQSGIVLISKYQEIQLISPQYLYGGTPDAIGIIGGEHVLVDWKTSNGIYPDYLIQLAAYKELIEHGIRMDTGEPLNITISGFHLCRFAKDHPDFEHRYFGELDAAWEQFKRYRACYDTDKELKKRTG